MIELTGDPKKDAEIIGFAKRGNYWAEAKRSITALQNSFGENDVATEREYALLRQLEEQIKWLRIHMDNT